MSHKLKPNKPGPRTKISALLESVYLAFQLHEVILVRQGSLVWRWSVDTIAHIIDKLPACAVLWRSVRFQSHVLGLYPYSNLKRHFCYNKISFIMHPTREFTGPRASYVRWYDIIEAREAELSSYVIPKIFGERYWPEAGPKRTKLQQPPVSWAMLHLDSLARSLAACIDTLTSVIQLFFLEFWA